MRNVLGSLFCFTVLGAPALRAEEKAVTTTADQAKQLAQDQRGRLILDHLTALSPEAAKELARHEGWLSLNDLKSLSNETAEALAQQKGQLHLDGLTSLSPEVARALARHNGELSLNGLTSLSDEVGVALAKHTGAYCDFAVIYGVSPEGLKPSFKGITYKFKGGAEHSMEGITDEQHAILQKIAWETVSKYPYAGVAR